ncbi:MAG: hypothetical protein ACTTIC_05975 [Helicobacteraceae bacterium]
MTKTIDSVINYAEQIARVADRLNNETYTYASDRVCFGGKKSKQIYIIKDVFKHLLEHPQAFRYYAEYAMCVLYPHGVRNGTVVKTDSDLRPAYNRLRALIKSEEIPLEVLNIFDYAFTYLFDLADIENAFGAIYQVASVVLILLYLEPEFYGTTQRYWVDNE